MLSSPIPDEMLFYARSDTHFLLYIFDNMRNELIKNTTPGNPEEDRVEQVLQKSKEVSLLRYERPVYDHENGRGPGGWYSLLIKTPALFNNEQFAVFRAIHGWRDQIARTDDDSTNFIMPNHIIFSIAKVMPMDMIALLALCHPVSYSVKSRAGELLDIIKLAKARGKTGISMMDVLRPDTTGAIAKANIPSLAAKPKPTSEPMVAEVDGGDLRIENSAFWGDAFGSSIWDETSLTDRAQELRLAVPLPQLSSEIFASSNGFGTSVPTFRSAPPVAAQPVNTPTPKKDEAFVLKRGSKRTSEEIEDASENEGGEYDISLNDISDPASDSESEKRKRKAQRKAEKKAKKEAKALLANVALEEDEDMENGEEPFDYSKAESVLHSKRKPEEYTGPKREKKKGKKEPFDPYAKSADAPKGMRRAQTERAGKSHTFKN